MVVALGMIAFVVLAGGVLTLANSFDRAAQRRELQLLMNGVQGRANEIGAALQLQVVGDVAVHHLVENFDPAWVRRNVGAFLSESGAYALVFVLDGDNRVRVASGGGKPLPGETYAAFAAASQPLLDDVRAAESGAGDATRTGGMSHRLQADKVALIDGTIYYLVGTIVQRSSGVPVSLPGQRARAMATSAGRTTTTARWKWMTAVVAMLRETAISLMCNLIDEISTKVINETEKI